MGENIRVGIARSPRPEGEDIVAALGAAEDVVLVGESPPGDDILHLVEATDGPDVMVLDLPETETVAVTRRISRKHPSVRVIVLSDSRNRSDIDEAMRAGARGYVVKPADRRSLVEAVRLVAAGEMIIDAMPAKRPVIDLSPSPRRRGQARENLLSERGAEVLVLAASGLGNEEIAKRLGITADTVRLHFARICSRLGEPDRNAAISRASAWGFLLGHGRDSYAIWKVARPGPPIERFSEAERMRAWLRWLALCADHDKRARRRQVRLLRRRQT